MAKQAQKDQIFAQILLISAYADPKPGYDNVCWNVIGYNDYSLTVLR